eukprot:256515-Prymnesium_polylepis.3
MEALGVSVGCTFLGDVTASEVAAALATIDNKASAAAIALGAKIKAEDGVRKGVEILAKLAEDAEKPPRLWTSTGSPPLLSQPRTLWEYVGFQVLVGLPRRLSRAEPTSE